jgi:hypothetical protein
MSKLYRVVAGPLFGPANLALARRYGEIENAVADMGQGVVVSDDGARVVAFHERHLDAVERLAAIRGTVA